MVNRHGLVENWGLDHPKLGMSPKNEDYDMTQEHTEQPSSQQHINSEIIATNLWFMEQHKNKLENFT